MDNTNTCWVYSLLTGQYYTLLKEEVKHLYSWQIPFTKKPKSNCNKCYGRAYTGHNPKSNVYEPCHKCITNNLLEGYKGDKITIHMPKLA